MNLISGEGEYVEAVFAVEDVVFLVIFLEELGGFVCALLAQWD